ncbi:MAG: transketolase C-terminal domain-containing protein [Jatrophihabitantaceae bacterium]
MTGVLAAERRDSATRPVALRTAYRDGLIELMQHDQRVVCLDSDTGLFAGQDFGTATDRYLNLGIAEQNLIGTAAGLAATGYRPFVNTMATFASSRAVEFVKLDLAYNALGVCIAATHAGLSAGHLGPTHHGLEDLAVMRVLPNLTVLVPGDAGQVRALLPQLLELDGPVYLRLDRKPAASLPGWVARPQLGRIQTLVPGERVVLVACGPQPIVAALKAERLLADAGVSAAVLQVHTLAPFDIASLLDAVGPAELVVSVEEHWQIGGLGSAIAEALAEQLPRPLIRIGVPRTFVSVVGDQEQLLQHYGITAEGISDQVLSRLDVTPLTPNRSCPQCNR